jgi:thiol-disulfide isomerase/thioredoxin
MKRTINRTSKTFLSLVLGTLLTHSLRAQTITDKTTSPSASAQLTDLMHEVDAAETAYVKAEGDPKDKLWKAYASLNATNVPRIFELAAQDPASPVAFAAFEWVVTNRQVAAGARNLRPYGLKAVEQLHDHGYFTNPTIAPMCWSIGHSWDCRHKPTLEFLQQVMTNNPNRDARGNATFALACLVKEKSEMLGWLNTPDFLTGEWLKAATEEARTTDALTLRRDAERLFENVIQAYSNCPSHGFKESTLGEKAAPELYELQHLWIGQAAPEIEGEDLDGGKLKLSDYRGKVVLVSFWGSWCGPCMQMIPHERKLAESMTGKPFALVGVNSDVDRLNGKRAAEKEKVTWRSFWCGTNGNDGPIPTAWNVKGWPTVYVIDPKGTIRLKLEGFGGTNTDNLLCKTVDRLLKE